MLVAGALTVTPEMAGPAIRSPSGEGPGRVSLSGTFTTLTRMTDVLRQGWGWGLATVHNSGSVLDVFYPEPRIGGDVTEEAPASLLAAQLTDDLRQVRTKVVRVVIDLDAAPGNTEDAYPCSATAWSVPTGSTSTAFSASYRTTPGPAAARSAWRTSPTSAPLCAERARYCRSSAWTSSRA